MTTKTHPLAGVRVLDLSHVLAAPFCTRILSDLGADVIKIEAPSGDLARKLGARRGGMSGYFMQQNCGKRNVSIDIKTKAGRELVGRLAESSDIFVENFRPGVMDELGLGQEALRSRNPGLIYCAISGFGHDSPLRDQRAFAGVAHAATGMLHRQAVATKRAPTDSVMAVGDTVTGLQAVIAILAALHQRDLTGSGQFIDMAMHDALLAIVRTTGLAVRPPARDARYGKWTHEGGACDGQAHALRLEAALAHVLDWQRLQRRKAGD